MIPMIPDFALPTLRATSRTLQIIVLAMATGVCVFAHDRARVRIVHHGDGFIGAAKQRKW